MIHHIVMWRLKETAHGHDKATNARRIKAKLEALPARIPELRHLEVGLDFSAAEFSADIVLITRFDSREALAAYQSHPAHQEVVAFVAPAVAERRLVDFESP